MVDITWKTQRNVGGNTLVDLEGTTCELDLGNSERGYVEAAVNPVLKIKF